MRGVDAVTAACLTLHVLGCERPTAPDVHPAPVPDASAAAPVASAPAGAIATPTAEEQQQCAAFLADEAPRRLSFHLPGDPSAHPGCTLVESGALQCAEDVPGWRARSKVQVPPERAKQVLDEAMRQIADTGCAPCPRMPSTREYHPGYDPQSYPARLSNGAGAMEACGDQKNVLRALRKEFAATRTKETRDLSH